MSDWQAGCIATAMMHTRRLAAIVLAICLLGLPLAAREPLDVTVIWRELPHWIEGKVIVIQTPAGSQQGEVQSVTDVGIVLNTRRGQVVIARDEVSTVVFVRYDGNSRKSGTGSGIAAGLIAGIVAFSYFGMDETARDPTARDAKAVAAYIGSGVAGGVTGYFIGRLSDRQTITIAVRK